MDAYNLVKTPLERKELKLYDDADHHLLDEKKNRVSAAGDIISWISAVSARGEWEEQEGKAISTFVHDIVNGIQRTPIKAAFLKCAADAPGVTENVEKVHRACARASLRTGDLYASGTGSPPATSTPSSVPPTSSAIATSSASSSKTSASQSWRCGPGARAVCVHHPHPGRGRVRPLRL